MAVNILVTEDDLIIRKDIERSLKKLGYNVVGVADTGEKAIKIALDKKPDLALMDIMLKGDMTGIEAANIFKKEIDIPVVYLTGNADDKTLKAAKETPPHGYLLKPFKSIDLKTTIEMAINKHEKESELKVENDLLRTLTQSNTNADLLFVKDKSRLIKLKDSDIYFVEALKDYMIINTKDKKYTIHSTMKDIEKKLPKTIFQRVHRSYIINIQKIDYIKHSNLYLEDFDKEIPIGGSYKSIIGERINLL